MAIATTSSEPTETTLDAARTFWDARVKDNFVFAIYTVPGYVKLHGSWGYPPEFIPRSERLHYMEKVDSAVHKLFREALPTHKAFLEARGEAGTLPGDVEAPPLPEPEPEPKANAKVSAASIVPWIAGFVVVGAAVVGVVWWTKRPKKGKRKRKRKRRRKR